MLTFYYFFILSVPFSNKTNKREKNNNELLVLLPYDRAVAAAALNVSFSFIRAKFLKSNCQNEEIGPGTPIAFYSRAFSREKSQDVARRFHASATDLLCFLSVSQHKRIDSV